MKRFYTGILFLFFSIAGTAQSAPDTTLAAGMKMLFDYLLKSSRLNISLQDNITVRQLVVDAARAGYPIDTLSCGELRDNLRKPFYTLTPDIVRLPGLIVGAHDSTYRAMAGNIRITFSSPLPFENRQSAFYSKNCKAADTIDYTITRLPATYYKYTIRHYAQPGFTEWCVSYRDQNGVTQARWFSAADTICTFYAVSFTDVVDADRTNNIYENGVYTVEEKSDPSYIVNQATYYRPTVAKLSIETGVNKTAAAAGFIVKSMQNPSFNSFTLSVASQKNERVAIRLSDVNGRTVETTTATTNSNITVGRSVQPGIYYAEAIAGNERKVVRLLKL